jgi:hypothetical protein
MRCSPTSRCAPICSRRSAPRPIARPRSRKAAGSWHWKFSRRRKPTSTCCGRRSRNVRPTQERPDEFLSEVHDARRRRPRPLQPPPHRRRLRRPRCTTTTAPGPWFAKPDYAFDEPTRKFFEGKNYPDEKTALSSLRHADELARGRNVIEKPDPTKVKDWNGFTELGWNPDKTKYTVNKPTLKDGETIDEGLFGAFVDIAHANKVPPFQAEAIFTAMHELEQTQSKDAATRGAAEKRKLDQKLRTEWGADYDSKIAGARRAFAFLGGEDFNADEISAAIGSPRTAKLFAKLHELIGEDHMPAPGAGGSGPLSPNSAKAERLGLESDPNWMKVFQNPRDPKHADYVAHRQRLIEIEAKGSRAA